MAKEKIEFVCQECGYNSLKWLGHCPGCGAWNSFVEERTIKRPSSRNTFVPSAKPVPLSKIVFEHEPRMVIGLEELDRVLGGGIVAGSLILLGGDPGIGKSTLLMDVAARISEQNEVLYVSGEESPAQTKMRADRLGKNLDKFLVMAETNLEDIIHEALKIKPKVVIIDSIQTMYLPDIPSAPGSVGQVRECCAKLLRLAKESNITVFIVGHVTKEGNIAGPKLLEHMVDVVLYFEGEKSYAFRILRAIKNRFGSTSESGIFSMEQGGLKEVKSPTSILLSERPHDAPGSVVCACMEGARPYLVEIQALVSTTVFGMPRRMAVGFDYNRLVLLTAVLEKRVGLMLGNQDIYVNAVGGIKLTEPAVDLGVILAIASSFRSTCVNPASIVMGEVGLTGEVRMIAKVEERIKEGINFGFSRFIIPKGNAKDLKIQNKNIEIIGVSTVEEALEKVE